MGRHPLEEIMGAGAPGITIATFLFIFAEILYPSAESDSDIALIYPLIIISAILFFSSSVFLMVYFWNKHSDYEPKTLPTHASSMTLIFAIFALLAAGFFIIYEKILDNFMSFGEAVIITLILFTVYSIYKSFR